MKTLPTLRDKKRYIAFEAACEHTITRQELISEILNSTCSLYGDAGCSEINPMLMSFDGRYGIVRCTREKTTQVRASLACINNTKSIRVSILVLGISGTIKGAMEKFIQKTLIKELEPKKE
ncbi:MAG: Rpp14/Pop5 family protein [Candidatus Methanoperedens sp.]|nr:ribonuclease P [Candidatus Methanoperedens sp.]MCZ7396465.1 ribonuclease P [Candidatus Methanoperedens sp.]